MDVVEDCNVETDEGGMTLILDGDFTKVLRGLFEAPGSAGDFIDSSSQPG